MHVLNQKLCEFLIRFCVKTSSAQQADGVLIAEHHDLISVFDRMKPTPREFSLKSRAANVSLHVGGSASHHTA